MMILKCSGLMPFKNHRTLILSLCSVLLLSACTNETDNFDDLYDFMQEVREREKPKVDPLPELTKIEPFQYTASSKNSPFSIENVVPKAETTLEIDSVLSDQSRPRERLEYFALDSLKMVGTLNSKNNFYAIVFAPDNTVHRVTKGNYVGTQSGKITSISDAEILLEETVRARNGKWEKRKVSIAISE